MERPARFGIKHDKELWVKYARGTSDSDVYYLTQAQYEFETSFSWSISRKEDQDKYRHANTYTRTLTTNDWKRERRDLDVIT